MKVMKNSIMQCAIAAMACLTCASCANESESLISRPTTTTPAVGKAHVKLVCGMDVSVTSTPLRHAMGGSRAALTANGKALTHLYIMDYDKQSGKLLQVLHQTSSANDFAEPDLMLDYGEHTLKVVATRSESPQLNLASGNAWNHTPDVLTHISADVPVSVTSNKTSDTFGAQKDVTVTIGKATTVNITLERLVAMLIVNSTDQFPTDCTTMQLSLDEHRAFAFDGFDVTKAVKNQRTSDVSSLRGTTGTTINYFFLVPSAGYSTDITFTMNRTDGAPYSVITVPNVPFTRNHQTTVTGSFYTHQQDFKISLADTWSDERHEIDI